MLDPLLIKTIATGFGLLLLLSAVHKLSSASSFRATLAAYQLLPDALVAPASRAIPIVELLLGGSWLLGYYAIRGTAVATAALLAVYTAAMLINIFRGRVHIDCGCGFSASSAGRQQLSTGLVLRNFALIAAALAAAVPVAPRELGAFDYVALVAATVALVFLYAATNQLLTNGAAIGAWRDGHD